MYGKKCILLFGQNTVAINVGIVQTTKEAVEKLFQKYSIAPEYAYLLKDDDGITFVFHRPIINALKLNSLRLRYWEEMLAQISITVD